MVDCWDTPDWLADIQSDTAALLTDLRWGTVPAWLGAGSLILAFVVFMRDRRNDDRSQVDLVGAWGFPEYDVKMPGAAEVVKATIHMRLRNASELPVIVRRLAYEVHTSWLLPDPQQPHVWMPVDGTAPNRHFIDDHQVAPDETKESFGEVDLAHLAPEGSRQLAPIGGVTVRVAWMLVTDNAGRRWVVNARKGKRAKRVRWWWRPEEYMRRKW